jgi:type II secretory pathway pseudopilin PulG
MILAFTVLLGVTLGSVLISLLLWQNKQQKASLVIQAARRS